MDILLIAGIIFSIQSEHARFDAIVPSHPVILFSSQVLPIFSRPLSSDLFLDRISALSKDYRNATEFFIVDERGAAKAESMAAADLEITKKWSDVILKTIVVKELDKGGWIAYKDISHRLEPIVAHASIDGSVTIWSTSEQVGALLVASASKSVVESEDAAKDFAMEHLKQYFKVPKFSKKECKFYLKEYDGIWAGYLNYGLIDLPTAKNKKVMEWYHSVLLITDGQNTIVRMVFIESGKYAERKDTGGSSIWPTPKTKSRFDE